MSELPALTKDETIEIFCGPRDIPEGITARVEQLLNDGAPMVNVERFGDFVLQAAASGKPANGPELYQSTFELIVMLGSCSTLMAWQQTGDIRIPRPRRLYEHNQSVFNTYRERCAHAFSDPRDRLLLPMLALQDGGKAHCVAMTGTSRQQGVHNIRVARNILGPLPSDILTPDEKTVIELLVQQSAIGTALGHYNDRGAELEETIQIASAKLDTLRRQCPHDYRDRFDDYLLVSFFADAGAHTQKACFTDAKSGEVLPDVLPENRFTPDGEETMLTLDRIFDDSRPDLALCQPKHLEVMRRLFPYHFQ